MSIFLQTTLKYLFLVIILWMSSVASLRICEQQGTCKKCDNNRFSYYMCRTSFECFPDEKCVEGFCCPYMTFTEQPAPALAVSDVPETTVTLTCPDGSGWTRMCRTDNDCIFGEEVCANGKCCGSCRQRRLQVLRELQNFINIYGAYVPQCSGGDGRHYHATQCMSGTNECWCVTKYGERLVPSLTKAAHELDCDDMVAGFDAATTRMTTEADVERTTERPRQRITTRKNSDRDVLETDEAEERTTTTPRKLQSTTLATPRYETTQEATSTKKKEPDETEFLREFFQDAVTCGRNEEIAYCHYSPCQASCKNPTKSLCPSAEKCIDGCHCKTGFIRRTDDPKSECITEHQCHKATTTVVGKNSASELLCDDPLKEYSYCGTPCQMSCETRWGTSCQWDRCVKGCFCKMPYILETNKDPEKAKCILPAQCPLMQDLFKLQAAYQEEAPRPEINPFATQHFFGNPLSTTITLHRCPDPLKNYLRCGSECPPACNQIMHNCSLNCVAGCFCRTPYILKDINDPNSPCVLPQHCPSRFDDPNRSVIRQCTDPRKIWTTCFSKKCVRTCTHWQPFCNPTDCRPGCECRPPYVLKEINDPDSPCILLDECPRPEVISISKCKDPLKEFHSCASSCPLACDNLQAQVCSPCISGCFCKNGYVLESSRNWLESKCVKINQCTPELTSQSIGRNEQENSVNKRIFGGGADEKSSEKEDQTLKKLEEEESRRQKLKELEEEEARRQRLKELQEKEEEEARRQKLTQHAEGLIPQPDLATTKIMSKEEAKGERTTISPTEEPERPRSQSILLVPSMCPKNGKDRGGRSCLSDFDCGFQQRCCNISTDSIFHDPPKCTCLDPNAIWVECGTLCPEYCGQPSTPKCSPTCNSGCHCAPGYVKARNDLVAPCIPKNECSKLDQSRRNLNFDMEHEQAPSEGPQTTTSGPYEHLLKQNQGQGYAGAELYSREGSLLGKFIFVKINGKMLLKGKIYALPKDSLDFAIDIHQFGDSIVSGCRHIGWSIGLKGDSQNHDAFSTNWLRFHVDPNGQNPPFELERNLDQEQLDNYLAIIGRSLVLHRLVKNNETSQFLTGEPVSCATIGFYQI